jgi:hypothetical protein
MVLMLLLLKNNALGASAHGSHFYKMKRIGFSEKSNITTNEIYIMNFRSTNRKRYLGSFILTMSDENCCQIYSGT